MSSDESNSVSDDEDVGKQMKFTGEKVGLETSPKKAAAASGSPMKLNIKQKITSSRQSQLEFLNKVNRGKSSDPLKSSMNNYFLNASS